MNKKFLIILALLLAVGAYFAISNPQRGMEGMIEDKKGSEEATETNSVEVKNYAYFPQRIRVKKGTKVTWKNYDLVPHTVTKDSESESGPDSELFGKDKSYTFTFSEKGTYSYFCKPHPYMKGTVEVID